MFKVQKEDTKNNKRCSNTVLPPISENTPQLFKINVLPLSRHRFHFVPAQQQTPHAPKLTRHVTFKFSLFLVKVAVM